MEQVINRISNSDVSTWALPEGAIGRLGRGRINDLAFSPDGESLAVATTIGVWLYELATLEPIALWETERGLVSTVAFSPDGQWIATSNWDGVIKVWDAETQRCTAKIQRSRYRNALAFPRIADTSLHPGVVTVVLMYGMPRPVCMSQVSKAEHPRRKENRHLSGF